MLIELNKKQYKRLIKYLEIAGAVFGLLGDFVSKKYKKESDRLEELRSFFLKRARGFKCGKMTEEFMGKIILKDKYGEKFMKVIEDYNDYIFWSELARRLAQRDFFRKYTKEEIEKMELMERMEKIDEIENKYWEEFEKNGLERIEVKK
jgi:hypothetical protein